MGRIICASCDCDNIFVCCHVTRRVHLRAKWVDITTLYRVWIGGVSNVNRNVKKMSIKFKKKNKNTLKVWNLYEDYFLNCNLNKPNLHFITFILLNTFMFFLILYGIGIRYMGKLKYHLSKISTRYYDICSI